MPTYEWVCDRESCNVSIEKNIPTDKRNEVVNCPICGDKLRRGVGCQGFQLKGKGWFKDGYGDTMESYKPKNQR